MKKSLIITAILVVTMQQLVFAQGARLDFTGGMSIATFHAKVDGETEKLKAKPGIMVNAAVDLPLSQHFSVQPGLGYVQNRGSEKMDDFKYTLQFNYLELPVNFLYNTNGHNGNFFIGAGPSFSMAVSGKVKAVEDGESFSQKIHFGSGDDDDFKGFNMGANVLAGFRTKKGVLIAVNYNRGLSNLFPGGSEDGKFSTSYFGIRVGYLLNALN